MQLSGSVLNIFLNVFLVCSNIIDVDSNLLIKVVKDMVICQFFQGCYGVQCCFDLIFILFLGDTVIFKNFFFWFIVDFCDFFIDIGLGDFILFKFIFFNYDFGMILLFEFSVQLFV